ncbi:MULTISPECIES: hypothetical protein [unclassified Sphingopyxis]|uniref:hypothetical protein n=1 Tax=unclassified Sphingopyxis TaxID=2614943 RepID=UPI002863E7F0|nr:MULTISPECIES: hypothetical protein [unclassified Sphingopyxis]MDR7062026.1 hypothetical protein [Sphingopyxis sp. BE235]MDR7182484.1 hypothetical protein [Sphingopyxis sp. BE249]
MDRIAKYLFWTLLLVPAAFFGIVYLVGQERNAGATEVRTCAARADALAAADAANRKLLGEPSDYEHTSAIFNDGDNSIEVGLVFRANGKSGRAASFGVAPDCRISSIN